MPEKSPAEAPLPDTCVQRKAPTGDLDTREPLPALVPRTRAPLTCHTHAHPAGMNAALVLGLVVGAHAGAVELTKDNFNELVIESGKGAIVKFQAPW